MDLIFVSPSEQHAKYIRHSATQLTLLTWFVEEVFGRVVLAGAAGAAAGGRRAPLFGAASAAARPGRRATQRLHHLGNAELFKQRSRDDDPRSALKIYIPCLTLQMCASAAAADPQKIVSSEGLRVCLLPQCAQLLMRSLC